MISQYGAYVAHDSQFEACVVKYFQGCLKIVLMRITHTAALTR